MTSPQAASVADSVAILKARRQALIRGCLDSVRPLLRSPDERGCDYTVTRPQPEESIHLFETIVEAMLEVAAFESRLKMLGEEILRVTRRTRVLEGRVLPGLRPEIRAVLQFLGEREREARHRLKKFKTDLASA